MTLYNVKTIWSNIYSYGVKYNTNLQAHGSNLLCSRVDINSTESLFGANVSLDVSNFELKKYCDCSTEIQQNENSISNHYTANCSITTQVVQCSSKTTSQKLISTCTTYQNRLNAMPIWILSASSIEAKTAMTLSNLSLSITIQTLIQIQSL